MSEEKLRESEMSASPSAGSAPAAAGAGAEATSPSAGSTSAGDSNTSEASNADADAAAAKLQARIRGRNARKNGAARKAGVNKWHEQVGQHIGSGENAARSKARVNADDEQEPAAGAVPDSAEDEVSPDGSPAGNDEATETSSSKDDAHAKRWQQEVGQHLYGGNDANVDETNSPGPQKEEESSQSKSAREAMVQQWKTDVGQHLWSPPSDPNAEIAAKQQDEEAAAEAEFEEQERELAAVRIQSQLRGRKARQDALKRQGSATVVQSAWRGMLARNRFSELMIAQYLYSISKAKNEPGHASESGAPGSDATDGAPDGGPDDDAAISEPAPSISPDDEKPEQSEAPQPAESSEVEAASDHESKSKSEPETEAAAEPEAQSSNDKRQGEEAPEQQQRAQSRENNQKPEQREAEPDYPDVPVVYPDMPEAKYVPPLEPGSSQHAQVLAYSQHLAQRSRELLRMADESFPGNRPEDPRRFAAMQRKQGVGGPPAFQNALARVGQRPTWMMKPGPSTGGAVRAMPTQQGRPDPQYGRSPVALSSVHPLQTSGLHSNLSTPPRRNTQLSDGISRKRHRLQHHQSVHATGSVTRFSPTLRSLRKQPSAVSQVSRGPGHRASAKPRGQQHRRPSHHSTGSSKHGPSPRGVNGRRPAAGPLARSRV